MFGKLLRKVVGSKNDRELNRIWPMVDRINSLEPEMRALSDRDLQAKTTVFKEQIDQGRDLDDLLPEAFAAAREAAVRVLGMRPFDVQLIGGIVLHEGKIAEMKTGEGKTLMSTLPVYLNGLTGRGVHVVTVNDYLAQRDAEWMGQIYSFMGLTSGCVTNPLNDVERQAAYGSDVTYGTNNEFGFDYLRDNMKFGLEEMVQRELNYAIVDEVDSILIDEARTPLIISGPGEKSTGLYGHINSMIPRLHKETHYAVDEKARSVNLTEEGVAQAEKLLQVDNLYDPRHIELLHHTQQALKAHVLFKKDVDYIVKDNQVIIVDEFTGRLMPGRRYSDGLHQALEAKEKVRIQSENQTLATITFQNYFRMYNKLAGMTGTADTEAVEFKQIYSLDVAIIPTHRPMVRLDHPDQVYRTVPEKETAVVEAIVQAHETGQPVLVGTVSIEKSEMLAQRLKKHGVKHHVLNAKAHAQEAQIIAQAGRSGGVTIATNMAGRGVDIMLGGNPEALARTRLAKAGQTDPAEISEEDWERAFQEATAECQADKKAVLEAGGLFIIGTERHESRRIDNQLRGRSGRQGDPGASRFYLSLEDDLLRIFGSDRIKGLMGKLGMEEGMPIEHNLLSRGIENAQRRVEGHNFEIRKHLLEYDDVMNKQRQVIYEQRRMILDGEQIEEYVGQWLEETTESLVQVHINSKADKEDWDLKGLSENLFGLFGLAMVFDEENIEKITAEEIEEGVFKAIQAEYQEQKKRFGEEGWLELQRMVMLQAVDGQWKDHLLGMDHLKEGIGLRGYGQKDPLKEYQREGFEMFGEMIDRVRQETVSILLRLRLSRNEDYTDLMPEEEQPMFYNQSGESQTNKPVKRKDKKVGRNDPCPCGSGKKYKKCCGRNAK